MIASEQPATTETVAVENLTRAIYALLGPIQDVIRHHPGDPKRPLCRCQAGSTPCHEINIAIAALDAVLHVHHLERSTTGFLPRPAETTAHAPSFARGLDRLRAEIATRTLSPDASIGLLTIIGSIDTSNRILATEINAPEGEFRQSKHSTR